MPFFFWGGGWLKNIYRKQHMRSFHKIVCFCFVKRRCDFFVFNGTKQIREAQTVEKKNGAGRRDSDRHGTMRCRRRGPYRWCELWRDAKWKHRVTTPKLAMKSNACHCAVGNLGLFFIVDIWSSSGSCKKNQQIWAPVSAWRRKSGEEKRSSSVKKNVEEKNFGQQIMRKCMKNLGIAQCIARIECWQTHYTFAMLIDVHCSAFLSFQVQVYCYNLLSNLISDTVHWSFAQFSVCRTGSSTSPPARRGGRKWSALLSSLVVAGGATIRRCWGNTAARKEDKLKLAEGGRKKNGNKRHRVGENLKDEHLAVGDITACFSLIFDWDIGRATKQ